MRRLALNRFSSGVACRCASGAAPALRAEKKAAAVKKGSKNNKAVATPAVRKLDCSYPSFGGITPAPSLHTQLQDMDSGLKLEGTTSRVAGRVVSIRDMGKVVFITLKAQSATIQVAANVSPAFPKDKLKELKSSIRSGDVIGVEGVPGKSKRGEVTLFMTEYEMLAPYSCTDLTVVPDQRGFTTIQDNDLRYRYRFMDMITNPASLTVFQKRHQMVRAMRNFFEEHGFIEVETPSFGAVASGANARPFVTHHNANDCDLHLRVAPELYLKQCVVGGMERVFEIGKVFRNEGSDRSHNPEFTSCEFYMAYSNYFDLIPMTEDIIREMATAINGTTVIQAVHPDTGKSHEIDFGKPFARISVIEELEKRSGVTFPPVAELDGPRGVAFMKSLMLREKLKLPQPATPAKLVDKLLDHFVTDHIVEPTFVMDHPEFMSPLAKSKPDGSMRSERFELFVCGMEVCNAYSELNDPQEQWKRFQKQIDARDLGDDESMPLDETFLKALQVGLPPTAGWGMGVDRMAMLLTGTTSIRDVIIFPLLKPDESHDARRRTRTAGFFDFNVSLTMFVLSALEAELDKQGKSSEQLRQLRKTINDMSRQQRNCEDVVSKYADCAASQSPFWCMKDVLLAMFCGPPGFSSRSRNS